MKATVSEFRKHCARPERIVWAVAQHEGKRSICPLGWKMNTSIYPWMMAISVAPSRFTHDLILHSGEVVLAWPGEDLAEATMVCGTTSGRAGDKFEKLKLAARQGEHVKVPLVEACIANLECHVTGHMTTGDHTVFVCEVLATWMNEEPHRLLCSIDESSGYDFLMEKGWYRFGVVKA